MCADLRHDKSVDCVTTIIDLEGISITSLWGLKSHLQQSISLTSGNYPETINTICVVNAPSFFPTIWGWVKNMFDEGTKNKVHILGSDPGAELRDIVPAENLPRVYGGEMDWKYEDEPMLDEEIKAKIGKDSVKGPLVWEDGRMIMLGEGRREEQTPPASSTSSTPAPTAASTAPTSTTTSSKTPTPSHTPAIPTAPGPPATSA
jgi:hypothetical protein